MVYQWYPGHMSKAKRQMMEDLKLIDLVIELLDARIPISSRNPDIDKMAGNKSRLILLNKADLADPNRTAQWKKYYEDLGFMTIAIDSRSSGSMKEITEAVKVVCAAKIERDRKRGIINRPVRAMIAGIPNVGKSTFINSFAGKAVAKTGNKPGVTKGKQWIRLNKDVELLDTPGILWPKFEDQTVGLNLAFIGSINDDILSPEDMAYKLGPFLTEFYPGALKERYGIEEDGDGNEILAKVAEARACLKKGGIYDTEKAAKYMIDDLRSMKLGRITLDIPGRKTNEKHLFPDKSLAEDANEKGEEKRKYHGRKEAH